MNSLNERLISRRSLVWFIKLRNSIQSVSLMYHVFQEVTCIPYIHEGTPTRKPLLGMRQSTQEVRSQETKWLTSKFNLVLWHSSHISHALWFMHSTS